MTTRSDDDLRKSLALIEANDVGRLAEAIKDLDLPTPRRGAVGVHACRADIPGPSLVYETCPGCSTETQAIDGAHAHARCLACGQKWVEAGSAAFPGVLRGGTYTT